MSKKYSLWLCPSQDSTAFSFISSIINQFAQSINSPQFSPHLTLFSPIRADTDKEALDQVVEYANKLREHEFTDLSVNIVDVGTGHRFHHCLFLEEMRGPLVDANSIACKHWAAASQSPYRPHVSLVYGEYDTEKLNSLQRQVRAMLPTDMAQVSFKTNKIYVVETSGACAQWYIAGHVTL
ncbi:hypothetical protein IWW36_002395 [Coemansia brasiliensis]|uniref:2',3'-cyclic-nucleotide 3'-phosphodiesterase n=1 Tax=Coemansia brasiliensis TaxID=2650707 RepID=A0A9W8LY63_9FUNG|nr:hypothetical protein IWW36_002395 [Coemansia brasiliensis]